MSLQRLSRKNVRKLAQLTGEDLQMVYAGSGAWGTKRLARTYDDRHIIIDVKTGAVEPDPRAEHNTSCPGHRDYDAEEWERA